MGFLVKVREGNISWTTRAVQETVGAAQQGFSAAECRGRKF